MNASTLSKSNKYESLMLLEFMVNCVTYYEGTYNLDRDYLDQLEETRVSIKFRDCCLVEIIEEENSKCEIDEHGNRKVYFGSGKSCLVSLSQIINSANQTACICVSRKDPCGGDKSFFTFGEAKMNLECIFKEITKGNRGSKLKSLKGTYKFVDRQCAEAGALDLFVRGTNLGKKVTTLFQLGAGESSFYFKGAETDPCGSEDDSESSCFNCPQLEMAKDKVSSFAGSRPYQTPQFAGNQFQGSSYPISQYQATQVPARQFGASQYQTAMPTGLSNMGYSSKPPSRPPRTPCSQKSTCTTRPRSASPSQPAAYNQHPQSMMPTFSPQYGLATPGMMGMPGMGMNGPGMGMNMGFPNMATGQPMAGPDMGFGNPGMGYGGPNAGMGAGMGPPMPGVGMGGPMSPQDALIPYQQEGPLYRDEDYEQLNGNYKEVSASVNGYEIKIKVLRRPKKEE